MSKKAALHNLGCKVNAYETESMQQMLEQEFWFVKIKDETTLAVDRREYEHDISLKGEFVRGVLASDYSEPEKMRIIACGIRALAGEEVLL